MGGWSGPGPTVGHVQRRHQSLCGKDTVTAWFVFHIGSAIVLHRLDNQFVVYLGKMSAQTLRCCLAAISGGILGMKKGHKGYRELATNKGK